MRFFWMVAIGVSLLSLSWGATYKTVSTAHRGSRCRPVHVAGWSVCGDDDEPPTDCHLPPTTTHPQQRLFI